MTRDQMQLFARFGAEARLQTISQERDAILQAFPDLGRAPAQANGSLDGATPLRPASVPARGRKGMSPSQRRAVGGRMKAYWAKRRAEKAGTEDADTRTASAPSPTPAQPSSKRNRMSPAARKAQGERMRAYWAARRAEKGAAGNGGRQAGAGAGSSAKRKGPRNATGKDARKK
jgi:hypothetical protein